MNRFVLFNCVGQTAGSFFIDMLQSAGICCIDEYFNATTFRPGLYAKKLFGDNLRSIKPMNKDSMYIALGQISDAVDDKTKCVGVKICCQQRKIVHDFDKMLNDGSILKIFHYRETLTYYMTKYFHPKWPLSMREMDPEYKMEPFPFRFYERCIANGAGNYISVQSEDIFVLEKNTIEPLCEKIGADAAIIKQNARDSIKDCPTTTIKELLETVPDFLAEEFDSRFSSLPYEIDIDKKYFDCRNININLGFIERDIL